MRQTLIVYMCVQAEAQSDFTQLVHAGDCQDAPERYLKCLLKRLKDMEKLHAGCV